jgi:hypothetical protein
MAAADIAGNWKGTMGESGREVVFKLKTSGEKVSGTMSSASGADRQITEGSLKGDDVSLTVASEWEGNPVKLFVKGKVSGDEMKLRVEAEGGNWGSDLVVKKVAQ